MAGLAVLWRDGPVSVPLAYSVPQSGELLPLTVEATIDGTSAATEFYAVLQVLDPNGRSMGKYRSDAIAAGASADVTWFPGAELEEENALASAYSDAVLSLGPWAFWKLADAPGSTVAVDSSGHGRTLNVNTSHVTFGEPGLVPTSASTSSFTTWVLSSTETSFAGVNTQTWTPTVSSAEVWLNTGGHPGNDVYLFNMGTIGAPSSRLFGVIIKDGGQPLYTYQDNTGTLQNITVPIGLDDNVTHQVFFVLDGSHLTTYLDGVQIDQQVQPAPMQSAFTNTPFLGQPTGGAGARMWTGFLGPVVWYDKVISASEVAQLYNLGSGTSSGGAVASVTAGDSSIVIGGTATNPTVETASLDVIATDHPTAGDVSINSHKLTNVTDPSSAQDAATKHYVDTSGGGGVTSVTAADTSIVIGGTGANPTVATGTLDVIATNHPAAANWSNNSHKITSVTDPTGAQDAATKNYVDTQVAGKASMTLLDSQTLGSAAANISISSISASYTDLVLILLLRSVAAAAFDGFVIRFNGDSGSNYGRATTLGGTATGNDGAAATSGIGSTSGIIPGNTADAGDFAYMRFRVPLYSSGSISTRFALGEIFSPQTSTRQFVSLTGGVWRSSSAINAITILTSSASNLATGSQSLLYGVT